MKIFKILNTTIFLGLLLASTSCTKYLNEEALTDISADFVYNTPEGLETGVVGLYNMNRMTYEYGRHEYFSPLLMISKTDLVINRAGYLSLFGRYARGVKTDDYSSKLLGAYFWQQNYRVVDRANAIIKGASNVEMDDASKNAIIAQAKFFRAKSFFTLYRQFNNIFVSEEPTTPENAFNLIDNKSTEKEVFDLLYKDLDFAIANLDWASDFGRANQGVARHLKSKVALWKGDWDEAKKQSEKIITDGPYSLLAEVGDVFKGTLNNSEAIFTIQQAEGLPGGSTGNMINWNLIPAYSKVPGAKYTMEYGGKGAGFLLPNSYLLDLLAADPNDKRDDNTYFRLKYYYNDGDNLPAGVNLGDEIDIYKPGLPIDNKYYERTHPACLKYVEEGAIEDAARQYSNIMIYRLAETYLIAAEANMHTGGDALKYINAVRVRAGAAPIAAVDQQAILDERARELSFEGQRWYTLKRMGVLETQIKQHQGDDGYKEEGRTLFQSHFVNFPIPQSQLDLLGPNYPQNSGY